MKTVVFAGPSVFGIDLEVFPNIEFRSPAACGDIFAAVNHGVEAVGLIDGLYADCAAVWHKEILYALSRGVIVAGAASMGALRAAECEAFGMIGVGDVFGAYRDGTRTSDADVAVVHAPAELGYRPLTVALVDAEATIATMTGMYDDDQCGRLTEVARRQHFSGRTWRSIVGNAGLGADVATNLSKAAISVKKTDALLLLELMRHATATGKPAPSWAFQNTVFFQNMIVDAC